MFLLVTAGASADTIILKNGTRYEGRILKDEGDSYLLEIQVTRSIKDERRVAKADIEKIEKEDVAASDFAELAKLTDTPDLLKEGEVVTIMFNTEDSMPLSVDMPASVILEVTQTEPGVKGNTATNATKPATVETGARINVPLFINEGDKIKIDTEKGAYMERAKE